MRVYRPYLPRPWRGPGWADPFALTCPDAVLGELTPPPDSPVLGGLPLTIDDFRTHRAPMPPTHMTAHPRRPYATPPKAPFTTYAISAHDDSPPVHTTHTMPPSRPDYRTAAHSGFAASAASEPPPLRTSPPPRSARLGSTTSTGRLASTSSTPTPPDLQLDSPPPAAPLHTTHTKPNRDLGWQCPIASGLSHGRPQWVHRVRRFCASSAPYVATSAIDPPRLHDLYGSSCLD